MIMMIINKSKLISLYFCMLVNHIKFFYSFLSHISIIFRFLRLLLILIKNSDSFKNGILFHIIFLFIFFIFKFDFNIKVIIKLLLGLLILFKNMFMIFMIKFFMIKHFNPIIRFYIFDRNILISIFSLKSINMYANNH